MEHRAIKMRLKPTEEQKHMLNQFFAATRWVYNAYIEQRTMYSRVQNKDTIEKYQNNLNEYQQIREKWMNENPHSDIEEFYKYAKNNKIQTPFAKSCGPDPFDRNLSFSAPRADKDIGFRPNSRSNDPLYRGMLNDPELSWITSVGKDALTETLRTVDKSFDNFFKTGFGYPKYRNAQENNSATFKTYRSSKNQGLDIIYGKDSVVVRQLGIALFRKHLQETEVQRKITKVEKEAIIIKLGRIPYYKHKKFEGKLTNMATVIQNGDRFYIIATEKREFPEYHGHTEDKVGIDLGIHKPVTMSTEEYLGPDEGQKKLEKEARKKQRAISRSQKGSNRRKKLVKQFAKTKAKQAARRSARSHQVSTMIVRRFKRIGMEDLKVKNMTKSAKGTTENPGKNVKAKSGLNRELLNVAPYAFRHQIEYKSKQYGNEVVFVNPAHTSQDCSLCGERGIRETQTKFFCPACGHTENADVNAAKNIEAKAFNTGIVEGPRETPSESYTKVPGSATLKAIVSWKQPAIIRKKLLTSKQLAMDQVE